MNRPVLGRNPRAPRPPAAPVAAPAAAAAPQRQAQRGRGSLLTAALVWVLIIYLTVPLQYFTGDMVGTNEDGGMGSANPLSRTIKLALLLFSVIVLMWKSRLAVLEM